MERQFIETKRYVDFSPENDKAYSIEYLKLYQAICSEIDVVGKEIATDVEPDINFYKANIKRWGYSLQRAFGAIKDTEIEFYDLYSIKPFENWEYEEYTDSKGARRYRVANGNKPIQWWKNYNAVKHQRIGLIKGEKNFLLANQRNVVLSLSALFLLESTYMNYINSDGDEITPSQLFRVI